MTAASQPGRAPLRAVGANERPATRSRKPKPKSLSEAAASGDRLAMLEAMRTRVATAIESPNAPLRELAALTKRLIEIQNDIDVLKAKQAETTSAETQDEEFDSDAV